MADPFPGVFSVLLKRSDVFSTTSLDANKLRNAIGKRIGRDSLIEFEPHAFDKDRFEILVDGKWAGCFSKVGEYVPRGELTHKATNMQNGGGLSLPIETACRIEKRTFNFGFSNWMRDVTCKHCRKRGVE